MVPTNYYVALSAILFGLGVFAFIFKRTIVLARNTRVYALSIGIILRFRFRSANSRSARMDTD